MPTARTQHPLKWISADADNNLIVTAADQVSFTMTGAGRSLGIASGDWNSSEPFKQRPESFPRQGTDRHTIDHGPRDDQSDGKFRFFDSRNPYPDDLGASGKHD